MMTRKRSTRGLRIEQRHSRARSTVNCTQREARPPSGSPPSRLPNRKLAALRIAFAVVSRFALPPLATRSSRLASSSLPRAELWKASA